MPLRSVTLLLPAGVVYVMILLFIWDSVILWTSSFFILQGVTNTDLTMGISSSGGSLTDASTRNSLPRRHLMHPQPEHENPTESSVGYETINLSSVESGERVQNSVLFDKPLKSYPGRNSFGVATGVAMYHKGRRWVVPLSISTQLEQNRKSSLPATTNMYSTTTTGNALLYRKKAWIVIDPQNPYPIGLSKPYKPSLKPKANSTVSTKFISTPTDEMPCEANKHLSETCRDLINNKTIGYIDKEPKSQTMCSIQKLLNNCTHFRLAHGYNDAPITDEERDFPLAFALKMHTSPIQAEQLLRVIYRRHNFYCIHVDKKSTDWIYKTMEKISSCFDNVHLVKSRENVVYASYGVIAAEIKCMKASMKSGIKWKYYLNLSGQEFPLRTNNEIVKILKSFHGANDIETFDLPRSQEWRYNVKYGIHDNTIYASEETKTPFPYKLSLSKGSAYGMFTRGFVEFILRDKFAQKFLWWLRDTYSPDETAWATLNTIPWAPGGYSMELRHTFNTHASRAVIWDWDYGVTCHGRHVRSVCVFGQRDLPWLSLRPHIFANKFDISFDDVVVNCLEQYLNSRNSKIDWNYFLNLPHVRSYRHRNSTQSTDAFLREQKRTWLKTNGPSRWS